MIGSHIIPKFYLEQFAKGRTKKKPGRLWVYEKGKDPDERSTSVQGFENGYFGYVLPDGSLEESFETELAKLESECDEVLVCAKFETFHWPHGSREKLARYAALLFSRSTQARSFNLKQRSIVLAEILDAARDDQLVAEITKGLSRATGQPMPEDLTRSSIREYVDSQTPASPKNGFLSGLLEKSETIATLLLQKESWRVIRTAGDAEFVTTDNPLITFLPLGSGMLHPGYGFRRQEIVAVFPLAPGACLAMGNAWPVSRTLDARTLSHLNEALIATSDRYVYSKTRSVEVQEAVQKYGGNVKYGENAFIAGGKIPTARQALRMNFGLSPD